MPKDIGWSQSQKFNISRKGHTASSTNDLPFYNNITSQKHCVTVKKYSRIVT